MTTGLFLGKFAPLHAGHQYVIETALETVDDLIVLLYDAPAVVAIPATTRAAWIERLYPTVEVRIAWTGPREVGYTTALKRRHEEFVRKRLDGREVTHFFSSEPYGEHMSEALGAVDVRVDQPRATVPISASAIRANPYRHREYIDSLVYRDLLTSVALVGGPSTGKTTLASRLAAEYGTAWCPEYGRTYWAEHNTDGRLTPAQLVELLEGHRRREYRYAHEANEYLFVDTNAITTYAWCRYYHDDAPDALYRYACETGERFDHVVLCGDDIPFEPEDGRSGPTNRMRLQRLHRAFLTRHNVPFTEVRGDVEQRVEQVRAVLDRSPRKLSGVER